MSALAGLRVLAVEDEPVVAMALEDMLADLGCTVVGPALRLEEALRLVDETEFDAAILDVNLGSATSYPVAAALRRRGIPFAFATGYGGAGVSGDLGDAGPAAPVIEKPYRAIDIATVLAAIAG